MKRLILAIPLCLVALGLTPARAHADPVTLTGGNVFYHEGDPLFVTLPASGVSSSSRLPRLLPAGRARPARLETCSTRRCLKTSRRWVPSGCSCFRARPTQWTQARSRSTRGRCSVPTILDRARRHLVRSGLHPVYVHRHTDRSLVGGLTTSLELSGGGTAALLFSQVPGGSPQFFSASYGFESAAAMPEPGTLLLVGAAAAGVVARRRRAKKEDDE